MSKLPVPYAVDVFDIELRNDLEALLQQQRKVEHAAFMSLAFEGEARRRFIRCVEQADRLDKHTLIVADRIAEHACLNNDGVFEIRHSVEALAADAKIAPATFKDRLARLAQNGLIEFQMGSGNGRPANICIKMRPEWEGEIEDQARKTCQRHIDVQKRRFHLT